MIKIGTTKGLEKLLGKLPKEVYNKCYEIVQILDKCYGHNRNILNDLGGFIAILEVIEDTELLKNYFLDIKNDIEELVDIIETNEGIYLSILFIISCDFGINVIIHKDILPIELIKKYKWN